MYVFWNVQNKASFSHHSLEESWEKGMFCVTYVTGKTISEVTRSTYREKKWLLDYRLSFPYFVIWSEEKMRLTSCFVIYTTAQFSCTNDLRSRKQEIRRGCRLYCLSGSTDRIQLRCHSHHIGTCILKGQTWSGIQHSEQALDKVLSPERVEINSASKYHVQ